MSLIRALSWHGVLAVTVALFATPAFAQEPPTWNRRVEAITIVRPAGTGVERVTAFVRVEASDLEGTVDLSTDVLFLVNSAPVALLQEVLSASPADGGGGPCGMPCPLGQTCYCHGVPPDCTCGYWIGTPQIDVALSPGDEIVVILRPSPGALPDADKSDDLLATPFDGFSIFFDRRIQSVTVTPTAAPGDSFFDVFVCIDIDANYGGLLMLPSEVELQVNGAPLGPFPVPGLDVLVWSLCDGGCGASCVFDAAGGPFGTCDPETDGLVPCPCVYTPPGLLIPAVPAEPGDVLTVVLRPAPGALPELPGFPDDEETEEIPHPCLGDVDGDQEVGFGDLLLILSNWGPCAGCPEDLNGDDSVGFADLLIALSNWGPCVSG